MTNVIKTRVDGWPWYAGVVDISKSWVQYNGTPTRLDEILNDLGADGTGEFDSVDIGATTISEVSEGILAADGVPLVRSIGDIRVGDYGAIGNGIYKTNGVATSGDATFTCASVTWTSADIGKPIVIAGAGAAGVTLATTIASINSGQSIELTVAPSASVGSAKFYYGSDDTTFVQNALNAATDGQTVLFAPGKIYMVSGLYLNGGFGTFGFLRKGFGCIGGMAQIVATTTGDYLVATKRWLTGDANGTFTEAPYSFFGMQFEAFGIKSLGVVIKGYGFHFDGCIFQNATTANWRLTRQNQNASAGTSSYQSGTVVKSCLSMATLAGVTTTYGFHNQGTAASQLDASTDGTFIDCAAYGGTGAMTTAFQIDNSGGWTFLGNRTFTCGTGINVFATSKNHAFSGNNWDSNNGVAARFGKVGTFYDFGAIQGDTFYMDIWVDFSDDNTTEMFEISNCKFWFDPQETTSGILGDGQARIVHNNNRATKIIRSVNNTFQAENPHQRNSGNTLGVFDVVGMYSVEDATLYARQFHDSGATGVVDRTLHDSASPAASDVLRRIDVYGRDSGGNITSYIDSEAYIVSPTNGSEAGGWRVNGMVGGARAQLFGVTGTAPIFRASSSMPYVISQGGSTRTCPADTSENILQTVTIPANAIGPNGRVVVETQWIMNNDASVKTGRVRFGGIGGTAFMDFPLTSLLAAHQITNIQNSNSASSQRGGHPAANGSPYSSYAGGAAPTASVDTTAAVDIVITGQLADSADTLQLVFHAVTVTYGA